MITSFKNPLHRKTIGRMVTLPLFALICSTWICPTTLGQVKETTDPEVSRNNTVYQLLVTPASEPTPVFKYRLTVEPYKTIPGNAITHYLRSLGESSLNGPWKKIIEEFGMEAHDWYSLETDASTIPLAQLKKANSYLDSYVENHLKRATVCREADWGLAMEDLRGPDVIGFLLPSVQQTRTMARTLLLRNRLAIIEGRFEDSIDSLRMTYQLGQNVSRLETLVSSLVGISEIGMANQGMIDLISTPNSPNMYWALAELPAPIISIRDSIRMESSFPLRCFPALLDAETASHSKEEWKELLAETSSYFQEVAGMTSQAEDQRISQFFYGGLALMGYKGAKASLIESGMDAEAVEEMSVAQVIMIDAAKECRRLGQEAEKTYYVPLQNSREYNRKLEAMLADSPLRLGVIIAGTLLPATQQVRAAEIRVQAQINALMAVEAIRHHLATKNELPKSLGELELPVRNNPYTGQPFQYELKGDTAIIELPHGENNNYMQRFEIKVKKN